MMLFKNRKDAGRQLAGRLAHYRDENPIVLALPRGGVVVGEKVARALGAPLDVIVVRKLGAPGHRELGFGAVAPGGVRIVDQQTVQLLGISKEEIEQISKEEIRELERRIRQYRGGRIMPDIFDRVVILIDDGLATGVTARAAIKAIRQQKPRRIVLAVPVSAPETADAIRSEVDDFICISMPSDFIAVGFWYENFEQVRDEEVIELLARSAVKSKSEPEEEDVAMEDRSEQYEKERLVQIPVGPVMLEGNLHIPTGACGLVVFAHGSGSSRYSPRNRYAANLLNKAGLATLLFDLLTADEETIDIETRHLRFDIDLLAQRLAGVTDWLQEEKETQALRIGYFGSSTGGGAALVAASQRPKSVHAVVSRGGRPDLAGLALQEVQAPTLLIVGGEDFPVIVINRGALRTIRAEKKLEIIPGATHLFEEPGALEKVARLAADWFVRCLGRSMGRDQYQAAA